MDRLEQLKRMLEEDPDEAFLMYAMAKELENQGLHEKALGWFSDLKSKHPDYVGMYYHLGKLLETLRRKEDALVSYDEGIQVARRLSDHHALAELMNAKTNLEME